MRRVGSSATAETFPLPLVVYLAYGMDFNAMRLECIVTSLYILFISLIKVVSACDNFKRFTDTLSTVS